MFPSLPDYAQLKTASGFASLAIGLAIIYLSLAPNGSLPSMAGSDKIKHVIAYAALAGPLTVWLGVQRAVLAFGICITLGAGMEGAQGWLTEARTASVLDMVANMIGASLGTAAACASLAAFYPGRR